MCLQLGIESDQVKKLSAREGPPYDESSESTCVVMDDVSSPESSLCFRMFFQFPFNIVPQMLCAIKASRFADAIFTIVVGVVCKQRDS